MTRLLMLEAVRGFAAAAAVTVGMHTHTQAAPLAEAAFPPLPSPVASFGAACLEGWLYVYGGHQGERHRYAAEDVSGGLHRLRLEGGAAWERLPGSVPLQSAALVTHGQALYRVGGMAAQNRRGEPDDLRSTASVDRYDVGRRAWEPATPLPAPRSSHDAALVGDTLYVAGGWQLQGGRTHSTWHDTLLALDLSRPGGSWKSLPQPFKRRALAVAAAGPRLYCLGGMDADGKPSLAVDVFDTLSGTWAPGPELPSGPMKGFGAAAVALGDRLYFSAMKGELHRLSAGGDAWEPVGRLRHPRFFHRLAPAGRAGLLAVGGEDSESKRDDLEFLDVSSSAGRTGVRIESAQAVHAHPVNP